MIVEPLVCDHFQSTSPSGAHFSNILSRWMVRIRRELNRLGVMGKLFTYEDHDNLQKAPQNKGLDCNLIEPFILCALDLMVMVIEMHRNLCHIHLESFLVNHP